MIEVIYIVRHAVRMKLNLRLRIHLPAAHHSIRCAHMRDPGKLFRFWQLVYNLFLTIFVYSSASDIS